MRFPLQASSRSAQYTRRVSDEPYEFLVERLIMALAAQLGATEPADLAPEAVDALSDLNRSETDLIFGHAGHLAHYDRPPHVDTLMELLTAIQRREAAAGAPILPGDEVRLVGELPASLADYNADALRETAFIVRYVGDDETIDIQPHRTDDYFIETVPVTAVKLTHNQ